MSSAIRYADRWALLRKLGFDCETIDEGNHRICEFAPTVACDMLDGPAHNHSKGPQKITIIGPVGNPGVVTPAFP